MEEDIDRLNAASRGLFPEFLGMRLLEATPDAVTAELDVQEHHCTIPGLLHGGAVMAVADSLGGMATMLNLKDGYGTTTIESKTNFLSGGRAGTTIRAECLPLHRGGRTMVWQTTIRGADGKTIAVVTQTQMVLEPRRSPGEQLAALFEGKGADAQQALLARLERAGAALYRSWAAEEPDPARRRALLAAAEREDENAGTLEAITAD